MCAFFSQGSLLSMAIIGKTGPRGLPHGRANGWYEFPLLFDPVWKMTKCGVPELFDEMDGFLKGIEEAV